MSNRHGEFVLSSSMAKIVRFVVLFLSVIITSGCDGRDDQTDGKTTVTVWYPFGSDVAQSLKNIVAEFERTHPAIHIKLSFASNNLTSSQKLFLAIAGGSAPDVTFVDGQQLAEWAARGALTDITDFVKESKLSSDDFWLPRWQESTFDGRVYALPWGADPNFALLWNKQTFREAGLDPERPPRTIKELDEYNEKITRLDSLGRIERIGIIPSSSGTWGWTGDNAIFTWGYAFGGEFYELPKKGELVGRVTADNPRNVQALKWMSTYAAKYGMQRLAAFEQNFVGQANNPFYLGKVAMTLVHVTQLQFIKKYAPNLDYGVSFIPAPPDGEHPTGWIGGWSLAIPRGVHASKEAFEFMRWMCTANEGTLAMGTTMMQFPAYKHSPYYDTIKNDRVLGVYYQIVKNSKHVRTLLPVQGYLMELLRRGVDDVLYTAQEKDPSKRQDPQKILATVSKESQERLEQVIAMVKRREEKR
jgi:multiple sugar transport system substrate-binding protein